MVALTLGPPPGATTHWTAPAMGSQVGISVSSVRRIWRAHGLQPHRLRQFKLSNAPSTPCSIATAWWPAWDAAVTAPRARRSRRGPIPTTSGVLIKGEFRLGNTRYCYPLTVTDHASRFLLLCEALDSVREETAIAAFQRLFAERGLPDAIRSDNGVPFASPNALFNLSKLSVWWLRLGIAIERIKPGNPLQNGRHERMHLTLKRETTRPPGMNSLQQQARFDDFVLEFNTERPHEGLEMKRPADLDTL